MVIIKKSVISNILVVCIVFGLLVFPASAAGYHTSGVVVSASVAGSTSSISFGSQYPVYRDDNNVAYYSYFSTLSAGDMLETLTIRFRYSEGTINVGDAFTVYFPLFITYGTSFSDSTNYSYDISNVTLYNQNNGILTTIDSSVDSHTAISGSGVSYDVNGYGRWISEDYVAETVLSGDFILKITFSSKYSGVITSTYPTLFVSYPDNASVGVFQGSYDSYISDYLYAILQYLKGDLTTLEKAENNLLLQIYNYLFRSNLNLVYSQLVSIYNICSNDFSNQLSNIDESLFDLYNFCTSTLSSKLYSIDANTYTIVQRLEEIKQLLGSNIDTSEVDQQIDNIKSSTTYLNDAESTFNDNATSAIGNTGIDGFTFGTELVAGISLVSSTFMQIYNSIPDSIKVIVTLSALCGVVLILLGAASSLFKRY